MMFEDMVKLEIAQAPYPLQLQRDAHAVDAGVVRDAHVTWSALMLRADAVAHEMSGSRRPAAASPASLWAASLAQGASESLSALSERPVQAVDPAVWAVLAGCLRAANGLLVIRDIEVPGEAPLDDLLTLVCLQVRMCALATTVEGRSELAGLLANPLDEVRARNLAEPVRTALYSGYGMHWLTFCDEAGTAAIVATGVDAATARSTWNEMADAVEVASAVRYFKITSELLGWDRKRSDVAYGECALTASAMWDKLFRVEVEAPWSLVCRMGALFDLDELGSSGNGRGEAAKDMRNVLESAPQMLF